MVTSDPVADMLTRIRNGVARQHDSVAMPHSNLKEAVAAVLKDEGYIEDYQVVSDGAFPVLRIKLKYVGSRRSRRSVITGLQRVSRPGRRVYMGKKEIPWVLSGMGVAIVTTSRGVMTGQKARHLRVGGEVLCKIW